MKEETRTELDRLHRNLLLSVSVRRVPPTESDLVFTHLNQASIGDGDAIAIASQILQDVLGAAKRNSMVQIPV